MDAVRIGYGVEQVTGRDVRRWDAARVGAISAAATLSVAAAMIHAYMMPQHFGEWWGYGCFFLISALAQGAGAVALTGWPRRSVVLVGVAGNLLILTVWALSRTVGTPLFGPGAGEVEPLGLLDALCAIVEALTVLLLAILAVTLETGGEPAAAA